MPKKVTPIMPARPAVPRVRRISAPAPWAINSGNTPRTNANDVMRIGRSRTRAASMAASNRDAPSCCRSRANSTIRMAFLAARPTSTTNPTCTKMFTSIWARATPANALDRHIGTTRITAQGSDQLSYRPASTKKTNTTPRAKALSGVLLEVPELLDLAGLLLQVAQLGPLRGHVARQLLGLLFHRRQDVAGAHTGQRSAADPSRRK